MVPGIRDSHTFAAHIIRHSLCTPKVPAAFTSGARGAVAAPVPVTAGASTAA